MYYREMLHDAIPFDNDLKLAKNYVLTEDARPKISDDIDRDVAVIIRLCWQNDAEKRPNFSSIYGKLKDD
jgi:hypothetical protein